jgi:hypothetical protein
MAAFRQETFPAEKGKEFCNPSDRFSQAAISFPIRCLENEPVRIVPELTVSLTRYRPCFGG